MNDLVARVSDPFTDFLHALARNFKLKFQAFAILTLASKAQQKLKFQAFGFPASVERVP